MRKIYFALMATMALTKVSYAQTVTNLFPQDGNVGIGTTSPGQKLSVNGNISVIDGGSFQVYSSNGSNWANNKILVRGYDTNDFTEILVPGDRPNSANLRLSANGTVSIGTINANGYKLAVKGSIHAQEINVDNAAANWPDYVFKQDYQLRSLADLRTYIDNHQHLPEIPSAQEIEKNGLSLGEMNRLLLKKVEELTLYLLEKDKKEKEQQQQIDQLKEDIAKVLVKIK